MHDNKDIKSISEAYLGMFSESKQRPIKFSGKTFTDYKVFNSDREANKFLEKNDDYGVIGEKGGKVYVAKKSDLGESKEDSIVNEHLDEANDMEGKDYTFVATVRGMSNARKKASEYSNAQIVQIDNDFYGVIVPAK